MSDSVMDLCQELADQLNNRLVSQVFSEKILRHMREKDLFVVWADNAQMLNVKGIFTTTTPFSGAEFSTPLSLDSEGILLDYDTFISRRPNKDDMRRYLDRLDSSLSIVVFRAKNLRGHEYWDIVSPLPHSSFNFIYNEKLFCRGVVMSRTHLPSPPIDEKILFKQDAETDEVRILYSIINLGLEYENYYTQDQWTNIILYSDLVQTNGRGSETLRTAVHIYRRFVHSMKEKNDEITRLEKWLSYIDNNHTYHRDYARNALKGAPSPYDK